MCWGFNGWGAIGDGTTCTTSEDPSGCADSGIASNLRGKPEPTLVPSLGAHGAAVQVAALARAARAEARRR